MARLLLAVTVRCYSKSDNYFSSITVTRKATQNVQHIEAGGAWATTAEDHVGFHFCQLRTES